MGAFAFLSRFAFSSEKCIFVAIRKLDIVGSERLASLRLSFELRLEMALRGLFSLPLKTGFPGRFAASSVKMPG
jgi:hypothetical protein